jgi:predicted RNA-binding protein with PUA-like domain
VARNDGNVALAYWLFKEEPTHYSYDKLAIEGKTEWTGVRNNLALKYLRQVKKGDLIFYYHTGGERQIVGIMKALDDCFALDGVAIDSSKNVAINVAPVKKLKHVVSLATIKEDRRLSDFLLVKISRLSVIPVTDEQWKILNSLGGNEQD